MLNAVQHANGSNYMEGMDPSKLPRPFFVQGTAGASVRFSGNYSYDKSGNLKAIGDQAFTYDRLSRLLTANIGGGNLESFTYDDFGNLTSTTRLGVGRNIPVNSATNRLTTIATYNNAGSIATLDGVTHVQDFFQLISSYSGGPQTWEHNYDAADERTWSRHMNASPTRYVLSLRGPDGKVLREYTRVGGIITPSSYSWQDYIYREGKPVASVLSTGEVRYYSLDHVGSVRQHSNVAGAETAWHKYWPYGEEFTTIQEGDQMKFTGHERDLGDTTAPNHSADDLDYMHARYYRPFLGRFISVDRHSGDPRQPQSWNRYSYVMSNPLANIDPTGLVSIRAFYTGLGMLSGDYTYEINFVTTGSINIDGLDKVAGRAIPWAGAVDKMFEIFKDGINGKAASLLVGKGHALSDRRAAGGFEARIKAQFKRLGGAPLGDGRYTAESLGVLQKAINQVIDTALAKNEITKEQAERLRKDYNIETIRIQAERLSRHLTTSSISIR